MRNIFWLIAGLCVMLFIVAGGKSAVSAEVASTQIYGVVEKVEGKASYQYGAGFRQVPLLMNQKWKAGDIIRTGKGGSVTLKMHGTDDIVYMGENAELQYAMKGKNLYISILKGSAFISAAKRDGANEALYVISADETFEVLGTHFSIVVDPYTGLTTMYVFSGVVSARDGGNNSQEDTNVYPGQSVMPSGDDTMPSPIDLKSLLNQMDQSTIVALLTHYHDIQRENGEALADLLPNLNGDPLYDEDVERLQGNIASLVASLVRGSMESNRVNEDEIRELINQINQSGASRIDIDATPPYDPSSRLTDAEKSRREMLERQRQLAEEDRQRELARQQEIRDRNQALLDRLADEKRKQEEQRAEVENRQQEALRQQLEQRRTPPAPPRPTPPRPERLEVGLELMPFSALANWLPSEEYHSYRFYVDGIRIVESEDHELDNFEFENLRPDTNYRIKIEALDVGGRVIAVFEEFGVKTDENPLEIEFAAYTFENSGVLYVELSDIEGGIDDINFEVWINGENVGMLEDADGEMFVVDEITLPLTHGDKVDIFAMNEDYQKIGYGKAKLVVEKWGPIPD